MKKSICVLVISAIISIFIISVQQVKTVSTANVFANETTIIIDAGHGGEDGGAIGADGTVEKNINLSISLKLNDILSSLGYKTRMVRTEDISIHDSTAMTIRDKKVSDIHNRVQIMEEYDNCIYVSIHQNKYDDSKIWGAQTFYSPNNEESKDLAEFIQKNIISTLQPDNNRVVKKSGTNIYVLYNAPKTAVMVECGFLSNPNELDKLKSENYQTQLALSITNGIINFLISEEK